MSFLYPDKHLDGPNMPIVTPNSPEGQIRAQWDRPKRQGGMNRDGFEPFPAVMYQAGRPDHTHAKITGSCTARDASHQAILEGQGWHDSQEKALRAVADEHVEYAKLAAERGYHERSMSEPAQREAAAFDQQTVYHQPVKPETPIRRRQRPGRKPKVAAETVGTV